MTDVTYERMSSSLGSLLLLWARVERSARDAVFRLSGDLRKPTHGITAVLRDWEQAITTADPAASLRRPLAASLRARLRRPLDIRNGLCHGLIGITAAYEGKPAQLTWQADDAEHRISWEELQEIFAWLSKVPRAIEMISNASSDALGSRMTDTFENRAWWSAEFAITLHM